MGRLVQYAENLPLNDFSGHVLLSLDSKIISANDNFSTLMGFKNSDQAFEVSYQNISCEASEKASEFAKQDSLATKQTVNILAYHQYKDSQWTLLLGNKNPINDNGCSIGIFHHYMDITNMGMFCLSQFSHLHWRWVYIRRKKLPIFFIILREQSRNILKMFIKNLSV